MKKGIFITFEGNDGAGKTTISQRIVKYLKEHGYPVIYTREPGGSQIAEQIRNVLLDPQNTKMDPITEALLYAAARRQHLVEVVEPALQEGKIVICDRFIDSSLAYQGVARQLGIKEIYALNKYAIQDRMPDRTIFLSVDIETGKKRMGQRDQNDRLDQEEQEFHRLVRKGYEDVLALFPERIVSIDANRTIAEVESDVLKEIEKVIHG